MDPDYIPSEIGAAGAWNKKPDGWWLEAHETDPSVLARTMLGIGARLVTMTAVPATGGEFRIIYHWDREGRLLNIAVMTRGTSLRSIAAICPAADWIEREIHDYFAVRFAGRVLKRIFLAPEDPAGALRWDLRWEGQEREKEDEE